MKAAVATMEDERTRPRVKMPFHEEQEYPHLRTSSSSSSIHSASSHKCSIDPASCPGGVLTFVLNSAAQAKEFYDDLVLSDQSYFRELDITLNWPTTYHDLKNLRDAILRVPQILKLRLDCRNQHGPAMDLVNRGKRANPLVQIMMQHRHLVLVDFVGVEGFFSRSSLDSFEPPKETSILTMVSSYKAKKKDRTEIEETTTLQTHLREVHIDGNFDPAAHTDRIKTLLAHSPNMTALTLSCKDQDFCSTVYTIRDLVATSPSQFSRFRYLDLSTPLFTAVFDRHEPNSAFAKSPQREDWIKPGSDISLTVIERFGQDLETVLIDDSFGDEHVVALERTTRERRKLKLLEMRIGFALIANSALTDVGQKCLLAMLRRQPQPVDPGDFLLQQQQQQLQMLQSQVSLQAPGRLLVPGMASPENGERARSVRMQLPTELMFAISNDRLDWFPFLGAVLDRTSAIRVEFHSMNKWIPLLDQTIMLPDPASTPQRLLQQQILPHDPNTVNSLNSEMTNLTVGHNTSQANSNNNVASPLSVRFLDQPPPVQTYPIRALEIEGTGSDLNSGTISSLIRLLLLCPRVEILILSSFKIESPSDWAAILAAISVTDLKELSFADTNLPASLLVGGISTSGTHVRGFLERFTPLETQPLKILNLAKIALNHQEAEAIRKLVQARIPGCKLNV
ncbi:hypothetical protein BGZ83_001505 [Gryganskiella cystojenkinii]|nr:hypothetical protein BGZ83_001505 [Gryganskiella cystojenkinii]